MTQAAYTTDLTTLTQNATNTNMVEPTAVGWDLLNAMASAETDYYIQGGTCTSATVKVGVGGLLYNNTTGFTIPTDGAVLCWAYFWAPGVLAAEASGGARQIIGSSTAAFYYVNQLGSDTWAYGGWQCFAMADPDAITTDIAVGSPTTTRQYTGWTYNAPSAVPGKGNPYGIDAIRYGRCTIQVTYGDATEYGRFDVIAEYNDKNTTAARTGFTLKDTGYHRLGIFQYQDGSYRWQGHLLLGLAGTPVDFRDSNRSIVVLNTKHVTANFNLIEVRNASSNISWTGISISKVGSVSKGRFLATDDATIDMTSCTFVDMDTFVFKPKSTILKSVFRRCGQVTLGSGVMTDCTFDKSTAAIALACGTSIAGLSKTSFTSSGTGHALEITGGTSHTLDAVTFSGYAASNGSTGNEAVFFNVGSGTTITVYAAASFSYKTAGATINIIAGSVNVSVTVTDSAGSPINGASVSLFAKDATGSLPYKVAVSIVNSGTTATVTHTAHNMLTNDKVLIEDASLFANRGVFTITKISDNSYSYTMASSPGSNPTGAKATWTAIYDTTVTAGKLSISRVFGGNQPVSGWSRKATSAPYYISGPVSGVIDSTAGLALISLLLLDQ